MQSEIRRALERFGPLSAENIAHHVMRAQPGRWREGSLVSACNPKRSGLHVWETEINERGRRVRVLSLVPR